MSAPFVTSCSPISKSFVFERTLSERRSKERHGKVGSSLTGWRRTVFRKHCWSELLLENNGKANFADHATVPSPFASTPTLTTILPCHLHLLHQYSQQHSKKPVHSPCNRLGGPVKSHIVWQPDIKRYMNSCSFLGPHPPAPRGCKSVRVAQRRID